MELKNQVCTPWQAKRLNDLGVTNKSHFTWMCTSNSDPYLTTSPFGESSPPVEYPAFTVAELGVMLPEWLYGRRFRLKQWFNDVESASHGFCICYEQWDGTTGFEVPERLPAIDSEEKSLLMAIPTEAEARAKMLMWLLDNGHVHPTEVNERLSKA